MDPVPVVSDEPGGRETKEKVTGAVAAGENIASPNSDDRAPSDHCVDPTPGFLDTVAEKGDIEEGGSGRDGGSSACGGFAASAV